MSERKYTIPRKANGDPATFEFVDSVEHLYRLSLARRSVYIDYIGRGQILPASSLIHRQALELIKRITAKQIRIYPKPKNKMEDRKND